MKLKMLLARDNLEQFLRHLKLYRWYKGGLWIKFYTDQWVKCSWIKNDKGYIRNPHDNGEFHENFNGIIFIEDYDNKKFYRPGEKQ